MGHTCAHGSPVSQAHRKVQHPKRTGRSRVPRAARVPRAKKRPPAPPVRSGGPRWRLAARYFPALLGAVSSPRGPLTAVFGMGTGVSAPPGPPAKGLRQRGHRRLRKADSRMAHSPPRGGMRRGGEAGGQAARPIRTLRLSASPRLRLAPVNPVVSRGPSEACAWDDHSEGGLGA